jgi:hypothetical protein
MVTAPGCPEGQSAAPAEAEATRICLNPRPSQRTLTRQSSAPFPKFVIRRGYLSHELRKQRGTSVPIPKFVTPSGTLSRELRNRKDTSNSMILVWFGFEVPAKRVPQEWQELQIHHTSAALNLKFLQGTGRHNGRNFKFAALAISRGPASAIDRDQRVRGHPRRRRPLRRHGSARTCDPRGIVPGCATPSFDADQNPAGRRR